MYLLKIKTIIKQVLLFFIFLNLPYLVFSQQKDTLKQSEPLKAAANIQVNNNGISLFPNLSLGKPAVILSLVVGKKNIFFEPELRWRINGMPWSYIFWLRYRPKKTDHFSWHIGAHPSYVVRDNELTVNALPTHRWIAQRNVAAEIVPVWHYSAKFSVGLHVLSSIGLDTAYGTQKSVYISLQPRFPKIDLSEKYYLGFFPQLFHLTLDDKEGIYYSQMLSFNKKNLPFYITTIATYKIKSTIAGNNFIWNIALNYKL
jgi:hypothetical protein